MYYSEDWEKGTGKYFCSSKIEEDKITCVLVG